MQLAAVAKGTTDDRHPVIAHIQNPSEEVQIASVDISAYSIKSIKNPTEKVQLVVIEEDANFIEYITSPSEKVQLMAVRKKPSSIKFIENPSEKVQLMAVKKQTSAIELIKNPTLKVTLIAYGKATVPFSKPKYIISNKNIRIATNGNTVEITNYSKDFLKIISLAEYTGDDIRNIPSFTIPPEGVKKLANGIPQVEIYSLKDKITFGYAVEYRISNNKVKSLYKTNKYPFIYTK